MKKLTIVSAFLFIAIAFSNAQIIINNTVSTNLNDVLSKKLYNDINKNNLSIAPYLTSNATVVNSLNGVISSQYYELHTISFSISSQLLSIQNFIGGTSFNSKTGYNSYGYIKEKYPIINPLSPSSLIKNKIIRLRYFKKLISEKNKVGDYLNLVNPIPEGERILLILTSLENVINITLENEKY